MDDPAVVAAVAAGELDGLATALDRYAAALYDYCYAIVPAVAAAAATVLAAVLAVASTILAGLPSGGPRPGRVAAGATPASGADLPATPAWPIPSSGSGRSSSRAPAPGGAGSPAGALAAGGALPPAICAGWR